jgi:hypothetical protein
MGDRLFVLVNPFWRNVESWGFNILAPGAKAKAQSTIFDKGFDETYVYLRFSVRGENMCRNQVLSLTIGKYSPIGKMTPVGNEPIRLGTSKTEPKK